MILSTHDFWCHISRGTTSITTVIGFEEASDTEISYSEVSHIIEDQVLGFDVTMDDVVEVEELETDEDTSDEEFGLGLTETTTNTHMVAEVATDEEVHD
jgi:hypothetical protein